MPVKKTTKKKIAKVKAKEIPAPETKKAVSPRKYFQGLGRRKRAVAQVRLYLANKNGSVLDFAINKKIFSNFFPTVVLQDIVTAPLRALDLKGGLTVEVKVAGGGIRGQAEAIRLGLSRALVVADETYRRGLRDLGYLTRDARKVERKKAGLKKARRAPQWQKR